MLQANPVSHQEHCNGPLTSSLVPLQAFFNTETRVISVSIFCPSSAQNYLMAFSLAQMKGQGQHNSWQGPPASDIIPMAPLLPPSVPAHWDPHLQPRRHSPACLRAFALAVAAGLMQIWASQQATPFKLQLVIPELPNPALAFSLIVLPSHKLSLVFFACLLSASPTRMVFSLLFPRASSVVKLNYTWFWPHGLILKYNPGLRWDSTTWGSSAFVSFTLPSSTHILPH